MAGRRALLRSVGLSARTVRPVGVAVAMADGVPWIDARRADVRPSRRSDEPAQSVTDGGTACPAAICRPVGVHGAACRVVVAQGGRCALD